jgi:hypothetical protein
VAVRSAAVSRFQPWKTAVCEHNKKQAAKQAKSQQALQSGYDECMLRLLHSLFPDIRSLLVLCCMTWAESSRAICISRRRRPDRKQHFHGTVGREKQNKRAVFRSTASSSTKSSGQAFGICCICEFSPHAKAHMSQRCCRRPTPLSLQGLHLVPRRFMTTALRRRFRASSIPK